MILQNPEAFDPSLHCNMFEMLFSKPSIILYFLGFMTLFRERVIKVGKGLALVNRIAFMVTFTKFRIWDYFWQIIMINEYPNAKTKVALITLFLLDCYWFILICKKAMKQF